MPVDCSNNAPIASAPTHYYRCWPCCHRIGSASFVRTACTWLAQTRDPRTARQDHNIERQHEIHRHVIQTENKHSTHPSETRGVEIAGGMACFRPARMTPSSSSSQCVSTPDYVHATPETYIMSPSWARPQNSQGTARVTVIDLTRSKQSPWTLRLPRPEAHQSILFRRDPLFSYNTVGSVRCGAAMVTGRSTRVASSECGKGLLCCGGSAVYVGLRRTERTQNHS